MIWRKVLCNVTLLYSVTAVTVAAEVHYSAGTTLMHATNINHQNTPAENEIAQTLRGRVTVIENSATMIANVETSLETTHYSNNQVEDRTTGQFLGNLLWYIRPGQLEWYASDIYTQTSINPILSNTAANRQNVNALTTGPNYYMRIGRRSNLELEGRLENYAYDVADTDNSRMFAASRLEYALTPSFGSNINYESTRTMYENDTLNDFNRNDIFLGLHYQRGVNSTEFQGGYTIVSNDTIADTRESRYLIALQNQRTQSTSVRAEYSRNISDTNSDLRSVTAPDNTTTTLLATNAELYIRTTASINITSTLSSGVLILNAHKTDSSYLKATNLDQIESGGSITNLWNIHGRSSLAVDGRYTRTEFIDGTVNIDTVYGATYTYRAGRNINVDLRSELAERASNDPQQTYDDTRIIFTLVYLSR